MEPPPFAVEKKAQRKAKKNSLFCAVRGAFAVFAFYLLTDPACPLQGRSKMIYLATGPVARSRIFQNVMQALEIECTTPSPGKQGWHAHHGPLQGQGQAAPRTVKASPWAAPENNCLALTHTSACVTRLPEKSAVPA